MSKSHLSLSNVARADSPRAILLAGVFGLGLPVAGVSPAMAAKIDGTFSGSGQSIGVSAVGQDLAATLHNSSAAACACRGTRGLVDQKSTSSIDVPGILGIQAAVATAYGDKTHDAATTSQSSTITGLTLLGGMITADSLQSVVTVTATPTAFTKSDEGTSFTNLIVNGTPVSAGVADNTTIPLPGLGSVTIKEVSAGKNAQEAHESVNMLVVKITKSNSLGLPVGAQLVLGHAKAEYDRKQPEAALKGGGSGLVANAQAGALLDEAAGSAASIGIPGCAGTGGKTLTRSVSNLDVSGLLSIGTITTTAQGTEGTTSVAATSATASNVALLGGLVTATSIAAFAQESSKGGVDTPSTSGSGFTGLAIAGVSINPNVPPNTSVSLPGVGTVIINEQLLGAPSAVQVNGLHVKVTQQNLLGLAVGAEIIVAHANAVAKKF